MFQEKGEWELSLHSMVWNIRLTNENKYAYLGKSKAKLAEKAENHKVIYVVKYPLKVSN